MLISSPKTMGAAQAMLAWVFALLREVNPDPQGGSNVSYLYLTAGFQNC